MFNYICVHLIGLLFTFQCDMLWDILYLTFILFSSLSFFITSASGGYFFYWRLSVSLVFVWRFMFFFIWIYLNWWRVWSTTDWQTDWSCTEVQSTRGDWFLLLWCFSEWRSSLRSSTWIYLYLYWGPETQPNLQTWDMELFHWRRRLDDFWLVLLPWHKVFF